MGHCRSRGIECIYIDANLQELSVQDVCQQLYKIKPSMLFITITTEKIRTQTEEIINFVSQQLNNVLICVGGHFVSYAFQEVLEEFPNIDLVSVGEGEYTIEKLINNYVNGMSFDKIEGLALRKNGKIIYNENKSNIISDLDCIAWPARDCTKKAIEKTGLFCMISSRGCYGNCRFCAINSFTNKFKYKKWRGRNIDDVIKELEYGINIQGAQYVLFCDDNFFEPGQNGQKRVNEFIRLIQEKNIKCKFGFFCRVNDIIEHQETLHRLVSVGLEHVFLGVESSSQWTLDFFNKGITPSDSIKAINLCRENGIMVETGFIMLQPFSTLAEIKNNLLFLKSIQKNNVVTFNTRLSVYYGSELIEILRSEGLLIKDGYSISYIYKNSEVGIVEKILNDLYHIALPIVSIFYELKDCVTMTWYRKKVSEIEDILKLEQQINDEVTDIVIEKVKLLENKCFMNKDEEDEFLKTCKVEFQNLIGGYLYLLDRFKDILK